MVPLAVARSRWLSELAQAVGEAQRVVWEIGSSAGICCDALDLYARLEVVRDELDSIRRGRGNSPPSPDWTELPLAESFEDATP